MLQVGTDVPGNWVAVTASDTTLLNNVRALYVGVAGNVNCACWKNDGSGLETAVVIPAVAGGYLIGRFGRVLLTSTTATSIFYLT